MAVTVFIFDKDRRVRSPIGQDDAVDLIHDVNNHQITISVKAAYNVKPGEYIGFNCVDDHFRLFCIDSAALDDDKRLIDVKATDAIVQDAKEAIIEDKQLLDVTLLEALRGYRPDTSWVVIGNEPDRTEKSRAYYTSLWEMITTLEQLYEWKVDAYYTFENGAIQDRTLEVHSPDPVFRGRIFQTGRDASKVIVTKSGRPITRLYGLGKSTGTEEEPQNLTFADVVWSKANGDPADKPKGQTWVEDPDAVAADGVHADKFVAQDAETPEDLLKRTWEELQRRKNPSARVTATVADMEMVEGYTHQQIRLGDLVAVVLKDGTIVEAKIIAIKRHYFRPWMTTITIGDKKEDIQSQVSSLITSATHTFERLTIYKNRFHEDEALIQLNAEHIQLNATTILEHAEQIMLLAEEDENVRLMLDGLTGTLSAQASKLIELEAANGDVLLRLDGVDDTLTAQASKLIELEAANGDVLLRLDGVDDTLTAQASKLIELEAANGDVLLRLDGVDNTLTAQADEIYLKANKTYVDNLVAQYVKAEEIEAEILSVVDSAYIEEMLEVADLRVGGITAVYVSADGVDANDVTAGSLSTGSLTIDGTAFVPGNYITVGDLTGRLSNYATHAWVLDRNYATVSEVSGWANELLALESRVSALESKS